MDRRGFLSVGAAIVGVMAGCSTGRDSGDDGTPRPPSQVTTSAGADIDILIAQLTFDDESLGPDIYYRLRNAGDSDATIRVETVLSIEGGGTYPAAAVITVPAGDEVTLRYRIVRFDALSEAERTKVRNVEGIDFQVFINGQERPDA